MLVCQRDLLHQLGCDKYQGHLYNKAIPYSELIEYIRRTNGTGIAIVHMEYRGL